MISLRLSHLDPDRARRSSWWSLVAATAVTCGAFMSVLASLPYAVPATGSARVDESAVERIVLVEPRAAAPPPTAEAPSPAPIRSSTPVRSRPVADAPAVDTGTIAPVAPTTATPDRTELSPALSPDATPRLALPHSERAGGWLIPRRAHDPFGEPAPLTPAERDSVLVALSATTPDAAARRVATRAERDSAAKEAMQKIRQSGRILLVPPDNSGGMITAPLPLLGRGPSRAERARDERALDEGRARLLRLRARADSLRRARADSLAH